MSGGREVRLVHSSDVHVGDPLVPGGHCGLTELERVLATASALEADAVLLAGDTFDNPRVSDAVLRQTCAAIEAAGRLVVLLPGNHDPALEPCVFRRAGLLDVPHVRVLGINCDRVTNAEADLEIVGLPHRGYSDFPPLPSQPWPRATRWHVVMAHGHYVAPGDEAAQAHRAWRFDDAMIDAVRADYVALGHWDRPLQISTNAYYSGSPDLAGTVNLVRLCCDGAVVVERRDVVEPC